VWGPVSLTLAPIAVWAQNRAFALVPNGQAGRMAFGDAIYPGVVDLPQRFGDAPLALLDPGESTLRIDVARLSAGVSTASQWWGPMAHYPYVLGNNAGGFPHVFGGTSRPWNVGIGRLHGRVVYGQLAQSDYSPATGEGRRFGAGAVAVFLPRGLPGLEAGATRFFHVTWPRGGPGIRDFAKVFEGILKTSAIGVDETGTPISDDHNQLASVFARLVLPRSGVEVYGEFGREDHSTDLRDLALEPDHISTYGVGIRRVWGTTSTMTVVGAELMNFRTSHLRAVRGETPVYLHGGTTQGHTQRGQLLGAGIGVRSGDASTIEVKRFDQRGVSALTLRRFGTTEPVGARYVAEIERVRDRGNFEWRGGVGLVRDLGGLSGDRTNLRFRLGAGWRPR